VFSGVSHISEEMFATIVGVFFDHLIGHPPGAEIQYGLLSSDMTCTFWPMRFVNARVLRCSHPGCHIITTVLRDLALLYSALDDHICHLNGSGLLPSSAPEVFRPCLQLTACTSNIILDTITSTNMFPSKA
jgi:hypothetical protein